MGVAYPGWYADTEGEYIKNNPRHDEMGEDYGEAYDEDDPKIFRTFESKISQLKKSTSLEELKKEYRKLALKYHPDKGGDHETFIEIQSEYERLCESI
jgi:DnaJ-class molecular chaperone